MWEKKAKTAEKKKPKQKQKARERVRAKVEKNEEYDDDDETRVIIRRVSGRARRSLELKSELHANEKSKWN